MDQYHTIGTIGPTNDTIGTIPTHWLPENIQGSLVSSPEQLGSQGELIVYPSSRRPSVVRRRRRRRSQWSKIFFSETAGPIKTKFYVEPPWVGGTIFCSRHLGHV